MYVSPSERSSVRKPYRARTVAKEISSLSSRRSIFFLSSLWNRVRRYSPKVAASGRKPPGPGKPVPVMRDTTERPEAVDAGTVKLVGTNYDLIISEVSKLLDNPAYYNSTAQATNPYGDGLACERIISFIE